MGQYYIIANIDKREYINPFDFDSGAKICEWSYAYADPVVVFMRLMLDRWKGDRVYVVGDYAEADEPDAAWYSAYTDAVYQIHPGSKSKLYNLVRKNCRQLTPFKEDISALIIGHHADVRHLYIYNHALKKYIDLRHCPIEWGFWSDDGVHLNSFAPLPLLLAMGNDRGMGDYHEGNSGYEHIGTWCDTVRSVEVTDRPLPGAVSYQEFRPDFTESKRLIPYTDAQKVIAETFDAMKREESYAD